MYWTDKHVLCCIASHCAQKGANDVIMKLRREVLKRGLDKEILVNNCGTIDLCDIGPNIVVYPDGVIYSGVTTKDIPELVDALAAGGIVERLVLNAETPAEAARRELYAEAVAAGDTVPADDFAALVARHGFDAAWVDEQARRGFLARKPATDETPPSIAVTTKARARYGI